MRVDLKIIADTGGTFQFGVDGSTHSSQSSPLQPLRQFLYGDTQLARDLGQGDAFSM
jgi:hypothetical protein